MADTEHLLHTRTGAATEVHACLPAIPASLPRARALLAELGAALDRRTYQDARLLTTEVLSNAIRHGRRDQPILIRLVARLGRIDVTVVNRRAGTQPTIDEAAVDGEGGFGLRLVDAIAAEWETAFSDDQVVVRFRLVEAD